MSDLIKVEGHPHLARDRNTGAVVNINRTSIQQARTAKQMRKDKERETDDRLSALESKTDRILSILETIAKSNG